MEMENKEMKKEIESEDIVRALEKFFSSGYTHLTMYKDGKVGMFMDGNSDIMGSAEPLFNISLQNLLEGFVEDSSLFPEDVKSLRTRNPEGVSFGDYLSTIANKIYDNLEME